jgi:predicted GNAT family acetyltransferase
MRNCYIDYDHRGIVDLTNIGEMVPGTMTMTRINIPREHRGKGLGTALLKRVLDDADRDQVMITLEIMPSGPLNYDELRDWYARHGFSELSMYPGIFIRYPKES